MIALILLMGLADGKTVESRTMRDGDKDKWSIIFRERQTRADGSGSMTSKSVNQRGDTSYSESSWDANGEPLQQSQEGSWGKLSSQFEEKKITRWIQGEKIVTQTDRREFRNPTIFWFWRTQPKLNESVLVTFATANQPTTHQIRFTYQGTEEIEVAGKKMRAHKVHEEPLAVQPPGNIVYTDRWFDDKGMEVERYHVVGKNKYSTKLVNWH